MLRRKSAAKGILRLSVTVWLQWRWLPLAPAESVVSLVATLSGQSLASVCDLYKRKATCEYSFGLVFFPSGMATHSYATSLAGLTGRFGLSSPAADQRPAAALREAPPNSDGSKGNDSDTDSEGVAPSRHPRAGHLRHVSHARTGHLELAGTLGRRAAPPFM